MLLYFYNYVLYVWTKQTRVLLNHHEYIIRFTDERFLLEIICKVQTYFAEIHKFYYEIVNNFEK